MNFRPVSIVLTATVTPDAGQGRLTLADPGLRQDQYRKSIATWAQWARTENVRLFVVESSGARREELLRDVPASYIERITFLTADPPLEDRDRGKGAAEWAMIASALQQCPTIELDETVYKVTGRLVARNATRVFVPLGPSEIALRMTLDRSFADTRIVGASRRLWETVLLRAGSHVDDEAGVYIEHAVAAEVARAAALRTCTVRAFPVRPRLLGTSGSSGVSYSAWRSAIAGIPFGRLEGWLRGIASRKQA